MANRMTPPAEGQEKDVLLVLDKQQGKVSAVKGIDGNGSLNYHFLRIQRRKGLMCYSF